MCKWSLHFPNDDTILGRFQKYINGESININNYPSYINYLKMFILGWEECNNNNNKTYKIGQYNRYGRCINIWASLDDAAEMTDFDKKSIEKCCQKHILQTGGYVWKFL